MEESGETGVKVRLYLACRLKRLGFPWFLLALLFVFFGPQMPGLVLAEQRTTLAVLPFRVHTSKPLAYLQTGLQKMLTTRMETLGFRVIKPDVINKHPLALLPVFETKDYLRLGKELQCEWVVLGSLTQIGEKMSIDVKAVDITQKRRPFYVFMVADDIEAVSETVRQIGVSLDNQITGAIQVDSIQVKGNRRIEREAIVAVVRTKPGDKLNYDALDRDLRDIYKMGFFNDVKVETEDGARGKVVIFDVSEKPSIGKIVFEGNKKMDNDELTKELGIQLYSILDYNEIRQSVNRLREYYREKGYYNAEIQYKVESIPNNEVLLKYEIVEHEKVYIAKIEFIGNQKFDDDDLKDLMETREKGFLSWLSWLTKWGYLDKKKLEFDVHKIASFYHNRGFINAKVGEPKITYTKDKGLTITIEINEGHQYGVNKVTIEGDLIRPMAELTKKIQINKEKIFNREIVRRDILTLREICADEGFAYAEIEPRIMEDTETHLTNITFVIKKGNKVRFERINISGNKVTRDKVIRRELKVIEGEYFSGKSLKRSTENLNRLGFFEDVEVQTKKGSEDDLMVLDIKVKERPTGSFSIGTGYSSQYSSFVSFQIAENNFLGYGQRLEANARIGGLNTEFDIKFVEPWLFDTRLSMGVDLYKYKQEYDDYTRDSLGSALTFGFPLPFDDFTRGSMMYSYDDANIMDVSPEAPWEIQEMKGRNVTSSILFKIRRDSRDRPWNTSRGSVNEASFQYAGGLLSGDEEFNRYRLRTAWFFPFIWKTVLVLQGRWGYIQETGRVSVFQKFRIGGMDTVRGFDFAAISPMKDGYRVGGNKEMIYNVEYRFPLIKEQGVVGLVFFDAGNVLSEDESWTFSGIRKSAGGGVRWYSPIGPLRLEYGINLDKRPGEPSGKWQFAVGGLF